MDGQDSKITNKSLLLQIVGDLAGLKTDMCWTKRAFENHLKHHWAFAVAMTGAALSGVVALILLIVGKLIG